MKKAIIGYIQGINVTEDTLTQELNNFGVKVFNYTPKDDYMFTDRFNAFRELLIEHPYEEVIHVDVTDSFFQGNPFDKISGDLKGQLIIVSEEVKIADCGWNRSMFGGIYSAELPDNYVLCAGVIYGGRESFSAMCSKVVEEAASLPTVKQLRGSDQTIVNKLVYSGELNPVVLNSSDAFAVHLHHQLMGNVDIASIDNIVVTNNSGQRFAIVHQFNRNATLYNSVKEYYNHFFSIDQVR